MPESCRSGLWVHRLQRYLHAAEHQVPLVVEGHLTRMVGLTLEAAGCRAALGELCRIQGPEGIIEAEVVGFAGERLFLMPIGDLRGLAPSAPVIPTGRGTEVAVGPALLGRVLDGTGQPLDGRGPVTATRRVPLSGRLINPLSRPPIREPLDVGVRAINALLTVGRGQRLGLFAGSGVGKSVLLGMMTRSTTADVTVVALVGERGREVREFIQDILGEEGMGRAVVVASPADDPPLMRTHAAGLATSIAEFFRDQGLQVLLLMDSLTRFAHAHRQIALSIGEPPATRGYPPSVFARLTELVERAGNASQSQGSVTAFYTVLTEADDEHDPVGDAARASLDGHIVLDRRLADAGQYPAIDVEASVSRAMLAITDERHREDLRRFRSLYSLYRQNADLIKVGAYGPGSDPQLDEAIDMHPRLTEFLRQGVAERVSIADSLNELRALVAPVLAAQPSELEPEALPRPDDAQGDGP